MKLEEKMKEVRIEVVNAAVYKIFKKAKVGELFIKGIEKRRILSKRYPWQKKYFLADDLWPGTLAVEFHLLSYEIFGKQIADKDFVREIVFKFFKEFLTQLEYPYIKEALEMYNKRIQK